MSQAGLVGVDHVLGVIEVVGSVVAAAWALSYRRLSRSIHRAGLVFTVVLGLTLAQPWGVLAARVQRVPAHSERLKADAGHRINVAGVPLLWFQPYVIHRYAGDSGEIDRQLKIRSWVTPIVLSNATTVTPMCGGGSRAALPCYRDTKDPRFRLWRAPNGTYYYTLDVAPEFIGQPPSVQIYRLSAGIESTWGIICWLALVLAGAGILAIPRLRLPGGSLSP